MYYLKLFDETLITFEMERELSLNIYDINIVSPKTYLFPEILQEEINSYTIEEFLKQRIIPKNRAFVEKILSAQNLNLSDTKGIIDICKGLSLNDSYWVTDNDNLKFADYNLYDNDFSETLSLIAFTGYNSKIKGIATSPELTTSGALPKAWRRIDGKIYLYKGSTEGLHFSNTGYEPYSEFYASQLAETMGIEAVYYNLDKWKGILASVCPIFTSKDYSYVPMFYATGGLRKMEEVYRWCYNNGFKEEFADMIAFDGLILNPDRHLGNFGVIKDNYTGEYIKFAPIFDCGEGLLSKGDINAFDNQRSFDKYLQNEYIYNADSGVKHEDLVEAFCGQNQISKLRKVLNFKFYKHPLYNLPNERLKLINDMVNERARTLIVTIENIKKRSIEKNKTDGFVEESFGL